MIRELKLVGEMLKNSKLLAEMKAQNDLLTSKVACLENTLKTESPGSGLTADCANQRSDTGKHKADKEGRYQERQQSMLRPQREMRAFVSQAYDMRHNVVTDVYEYRRKGGAAWTIIDKRQLNTIANEVAEAGIFCLDSQVKRYVESVFSEDYHPVTDYLNKVRGTWDGQRDYADDLLRRVSQDDYFLRMGRIWLRAVVAQWMHWDEKHANAVMLLLVSERQGMQKSTFLQQLLPRELRDYYTDDFSLSSKGNAQRKIVEFAIINMDEFDKEPVRRMADLKTLMQTMKPSFIGAYKKNFNRLPRIASFTGTSNRLQLLSDPTGSRRFLVVEPEGEICVDGICHDQLFAQLIREVEEGMPCYFSKADEREMERRNRRYQRLSPVEQLLTTFFRQAGDGEVSWKLSAEDIIRELATHNQALMREMSASAMGRLLSGLGWKAEHTEFGNVYRVVKL